MCDGALVWRHNGLWCERCHRKVETCCEGAPQAVTGCHGTVRDALSDARETGGTVLTSPTFATRPSTGS